MRRLPVELQVAHVLKQVNGSHAVGAQQGRADHFRADLVEPGKTGLAHGGGVGARLGAAAVLGTHHVLQQPGLRRPELRLLGLGHRDDAALVVQLENTDIAHRAVCVERADVDGKSAVSLFFLDPGAGFAHCEVALKARFEHLRRFVRQGRQVVAHRKSDGDKHQAQQQQRSQGLPRAQSTGAQNSELRTLRQARHDKNAANQHRNGQQLVDMVRDHERDVNQRLRHRVARRLLATHRIEFVDKIEEEKQADESQGHGGYRNQDFGVQQLAQGFHRLSLLGVGRHTASDQCCWRAVSHSTLSANTPPCKAANCPSADIWPASIQFLPITSRLK